MKSASFALVVVAVLCMAATGFARGGGHGGGGHGGGHHAGGHYEAHHEAHQAHHAPVHHHTGHHASYHHGGWQGHHDDWHSWHHGNWGGWNSYPSLWGAGQGLGWTANNYVYRNPFWNDAYAGTVNYAQPITTSSYADEPAGTPIANQFVNNDEQNEEDEGDSNATAVNDGDEIGPDANQKQALAQLDAGREAFRGGNYAEAQKQVEAAIKLWPEDVVAHEFRALTLFAQHKYRESAAATYAVLAGGPGWNEQTLLSFYPDRKRYEEQLAGLKEFVRQDPKAADGEFLLAYHQLIAGHRDAARADLERVAQLEPNDQLTLQLLKALNVQTTVSMN